MGSSILLSSLARSWVVVVVAALEETAGSREQGAIAERKEAGGRRLARRSEEKGERERDLAIGERRRNLRHVRKASLCARGASACDAVVCG